MPDSAVCFCKHYLCIFETAPCSLPDEESNSERWTGLGFGPVYPESSAMIQAEAGKREGW